MATSPKQGDELVQLQVADHFGGESPRRACYRAGHPSATTRTIPTWRRSAISKLDDLYRQKVLPVHPGDRQWLQAEARRDPNQFMDVAKRIGVQMPDPNAPPPPSPQATQQAMAQMLSSALQPQAAPAPAAPAGLPAAAPALPPPPALPAAPPAPAAGGDDTALPIAGPGVGGGRFASAPFHHLSPAAAAAVILRQA